ncbi:class I SAM-dependent methyltransferase, partial [Candidatus Omnitrophota bacterium]
IPLSDGTWLGIKGAGQFNSEVDPPFFHGTRPSSMGRCEGLAWRQEAEYAKEHAPALRDSGAIQHLGFRRIYAAPDGVGGFMSTKEFDEKERGFSDAVLIFNRVLTPHRVSKFPQILDIDPGLREMSEKMSKLISGTERIPIGTTFSPDELVLFMATEWGRFEAKKQNLGIFKRTSHSQDLTFSGEEADMEEMLPKDEYRIHLQAVAAVHGIRILLQLFDKYGVDIYGIRSKFSTLVSMEEHVRIYRDEEEYETLFPDRMKVVETLLKSYFSNLDDEWLRAWHELDPEHMSEFDISSPLAAESIVDGVLSSNRQGFDRNDIVQKIVAWAKEEAAKRPKKDRIPGQTLETVFFETFPDSASEPKRELNWNRNYYDLNRSYLNDISQELLDRTDPYHGTKQKAPPAKVLFIGAGKGNTSFDLLHKYGNKIDLTTAEKEDLLYETPEELLEYAVLRLGDKENAREHLGRVRSKYIKCDLDEGLQLADESYDVVVIDEALLALVRDKVQAMREMLRVCNTGGVVYCSPKGTHIEQGGETMTFGEYFARLEHPDIDSLAMTDFGLPPRGKRTSDWIKITKTPGLTIPKFRLIRSDTSLIRMKGEIVDEPFWDTYYEPVVDDPGAPKEERVSQLSNPGKIQEIILGVREDLKGIDGCKGHSIELLRRLTKEGITGHVMSHGETVHYWVQVDGHILDPFPEGLSNDAVDAAERLGDRRFFVARCDSDIAMSLYSGEIDRTLTQKAIKTVNNDAGFYRTLKDRFMRLIRSRARLLNFRGIDSRDIKKDERIVELTRRYKENEKKLRATLDEKHWYLGGLDRSDSQEDPTGPSSDRKGSLTDRMPAAKLLPLLGLDDVENSPDIEILYESRDNGRVVRRKVRIPETRNALTIPNEGTDLLKYMMLSPQVYDITTLDLLYSPRGDLIAVFPMIPEDVRGNIAAVYSDDPDDVEGIVWGVYDKTPRFLDLSSYYFEIPGIGEEGSNKKWTDFNKRLEENRAIILKYKNTRKGAPRDCVDGFKARFVLAEVDKETHEWNAVDLTEPLGRHVLLEAPNPKKHQIIIPVFPTVYSPGFHNALDGDFYEFIAGKFPIEADNNVLVVGPGTGLDAWAISKRTDQKIYAIGVNPLEVANLEYVAKLAGFSVETLVADNIIDREGTPRFPGKQFDRIVWNMTQYSEGKLPEEEALKDLPPLRIESYWDGDNEGRVLKRFVKGLPKVLTPEGWSILWNKASWVDSPGGKKNVVEEILKPVGRVEAVKARAGHYTYFVTPQRA